MDVFNAVSIILLLVGISAGLLVTGYAVGHAKRNNPGNIIKSKVDWVDSVDCAGRFVCFATRLAGLRALVVNLRTYIYVYKLDSIERIIAKWSPPHENPTKAYIRFVSDRLSLPPNATIVSKYHLYELIEAIIAFEGSGIKYTRSEVEEQVAITFNIQR